MARQIVQVNVIQQSSGSPVRVTCSYTSDGYVVHSAKAYLKQAGGYTVDTALSHELRRAVIAMMEEILRTSQLF